VVRRRLGLILACGVLAAAAALIISLTKDERYEATASLLFRDPQFDQKLFGSSFLPGSGDPQRAAATNIELVSLDVVAARAARALGGVPPDAIEKNVDVSSSSQSDVVYVTGEAAQPARAAALANLVAREYIAFRREADREKVRSAQQLLQERLAQLPPADSASSIGAALRERSSQLDVLASLQTGNAELVQPAEPPSSPSSPRPLRDTVLAGIVGLLLGLLLAVVRDRLDRRLRDAAEIEETFRRPILASIPVGRALAKSRVTELPPMTSEAFRMLRANLLYFNIDRDVKSVLITSASAGEGKSTVAVNLAMAAARTGTRTLLLELDLRRPNMASRLGLASEMGVSTVLAGGARLDDIVQDVSVDAAMNGSGGQLLQVAVAGPLPPNPTDLIESHRMDSLIKEAERKYELVVIDTPPVSLISDAIPLLKKVTGVMVVTRLGISTRHAAARFRDQLTNLHAPVLGIVVNAVRGREAYSQYEDYYLTADPDVPVAR
jgi:polysaccharide biosynthesis transport protein